MTISGENATPTTTTTSDGIAGTSTVNASATISPSQAMHNTADNSLQMQNELKKLVEYLLSDFRNLSTEAKKKHNHVKEAAESGLVKVRNISSASTSDKLLSNLRSSCAEIIHPLMLGCSSKSPRLVQISLQAIQRMLQYRVIDANSSSAIVNELWHLTEAECEELRVLQTITPFVSTELLVTDWALAKCIVLAIKLNFSKDPSVINAASAAVRQLFSCVFERVIQEDGLNKDQQQPKPQRTNGSSQKLAPPNLRPAAADGYLLLKDLTLLIRKENPVWLCGVKMIAIPLALELLEAALKNYPSIFYQHEEYEELLRNQICPQLIKLFVGERQNQVSSKSQELVETKNSAANSPDASNGSNKPIFPVLMRALRIALVMLTNYHSLLALHNEVIIGFLIELIYLEGFPWQTAMALEVLHKILVQPTLLFWLCQNYECQSGSTKLVRLMLQAVISYIKKSLDEASLLGNLTDFSQYFGQAGFQCKGTFIPLHENLSQRRWVLLDLLEKHDPAPIPDGYCLSIAYMCLIDCTHSVYAVVDDKRYIHANGITTEDTEQTAVDSNNVAKNLFLSSFRYLLDGLSTLLDCSADDTVSDSILSCISTLTILACRFSAADNSENVAEAKQFSLRTLCEAALPSNYFEKYIASPTPATMNSKVSTTTNSPRESSNYIPSHVVAMGTICPIPSLSTSMLNTNVMLTSKNIQVSRVLLASAIQNGPHITDRWDMILATIQHLVWILGIRPTSDNAFRTVGDVAGNTGITNGVGASASASTSSSVSTPVILTTMVSSELPELNASLNRLFESTINFDDVSLHHVIAALCKLSSEAMMVAQMTSREPSFFPVAKLLQTAIVNLDRLVVFWKPVTAHLLEVCGHTNTNLRDWGTAALTTLVKNGMKQIISNCNSTEEKNNSLKLTKSEQLILTPLASMSEVEFGDVKAHQLDCLMHILQSDSQALCVEIWPLIIDIVNSIICNCTNAQLIEQGYRTLSLIVKEFLSVLPFDCVRMLVETNARYGKQHVDMNVSLSAVGQLWDISDYVRREGSDTKRTDSEVESVWLVIYASLGELCVDSRPPVRKSACDTLLQTVAAHGNALGTSTWRTMLEEILFPMLDRVGELTQGASTESMNTAAFGASNIMIHHSRDTDAKQWAETTVKTLGCVVKIFNSYRATLISLDSFSGYWTRLLSYIEMVVASGNSEMSLAALKNFQELLFGRQQQADGKEKPGIIDDSTLPALPDKLWMVSWQSWLRIARCISFNNDNFNQISNAKALRSPNDLLHEESWQVKSYIPGLFHLTTLLNVFIMLFNRVQHQISITDFQSYVNVPNIFKNISSIPISPEQTSFMLNSENSELSLTQECLLDCIQAIVQEQLNASSRIRAAIPDMLLLLLEFVDYAIRPPQSKLRSSFNSPLTNGNNTPDDNQIRWSKQNLIAFAELSLRTIVEYYSKVANYPEVIERRIFIDIVKKLHESLCLKYHCPSQSTWKLAATSLIEVCKVGLPVARYNIEKFAELWPQLATTIESFLFSSSKSPVRLNADERKRHEFVDCLIIELIRTDILPHSNVLPWDFMQRIIDILNRGSINTMDVNDVMASDSFEHRADLSRVCFDALLSISRGSNQSAEDFNGLKSTRKSSKLSNTPLDYSRDGDSSTSLGATAIMSLLSRCKQVLNNYARDEQNLGHFRLPQERIFEAISVLRAVSTLIDGFTKYGEDAHSTLYSNLVALYPDLVQMIPSCRSDQQLELALMTVLNSYQTLLLINIHKF